MYSTNLVGSHGHRACFFPTSLYLVCRATFLTISSGLAYLGGSRYAVCVVYALETSVSLRWRPPFRPCASSAPGCVLFRLLFLLVRRRNNGFTPGCTRQRGGEGPAHAAHCCSRCCCCRKCWHWCLYSSLCNTPLRSSSSNACSCVQAL